MTNNYATKDDLNNLENKLEELKHDIMIINAKVNCAELWRKIDNKECLDLRMVRLEKHLGFDD